jgi:hypothetical protein
MYVNPDLKEMSQILTEEEMKKLVVDAIEVKSDSKRELQKLRTHLRAIGYKEVKVD